MTSATVLRKGYDTALGLWRNYSPKGRDVARKRADTESLLDDFARASADRFSGTVLVDGSFDNPNFWLRYSLLRRGLGLSHAREVGLIGPYRRSFVQGTFKRLGIDTVVDFARAPASHAACERAADEKVDVAQGAADVLNWTLPGGVHPSIVYDGILKRQRLAALDVRRPDMRTLAREALRTIKRAEEILDEVRPDLIVISHPIGIGCGSLCWLALSRGIPVVLPFGLFGVLRFVRFEKPEDLFSFYDRPGRDDMDALPPGVASAMAQIGRAYLEQRFGGKADDLASVYAFQRSSGDIDRAGLCTRYGWDPAKPIVAVYASNWFDWPHQLGMTQFRDFLDWIEASFAAARDNPSVNWLFKPHPAEDWFGGVALADLMKRIGSAPHVAVSDKSWNNTRVMMSIDALVTYHGTAGIEFASLGKPVLVPDRGKYEDAGFVKLARSRVHYLELLATEWWTDIDRDEIKRRAEIFAGWWFCAPDWQGDFVLHDDSQQDALYDVIPAQMQGNRATVEREVATIRDWWRSDRMHYHTFKMQQAESFRLTNVNG
jgi:hypothetical protein